MILRYGSLSRKPAIFKAMTGLSVALFDELMGDLGPAYARATYAQQDWPGRQRAVGAGHHRRLPPRDEFVLTVVWLRHYFTQEALGYFFGVSDTTVLRTLARVLPVLESAGRDAMRQPPRGRRQRYGVAEALQAFPELADLNDDALVVDTYEQRVQRPQDQREADRQYSGKKKAHTTKTQVVVHLGSGQVCGVRAGVCGRVADGTVLTQSGALSRLPPQGRGMGDKAYIGVDPRVVTPRRKPRGKPRPPEDAAFNRAFARVRITVEHTIRDLRVFQALTLPDRHRRQGQPQRVCAVVALRARRERPGRRQVA